MLMIKDQAVIDADTDDADRSLSEEAGRLVGPGRHHRKQHNLLENNVIDALLLRYFEFSDQPWMRMQMILETLNLWKQSDDDELCNDDSLEMGDN